MNNCPRRLLRCLVFFIYNAKIYNWLVGLLFLVAFDHCKNTRSPVAKSLIVDLPVRPVTSLRGHAVSFSRIKRQDGTGLITPIINHSTNVAACTAKLFLPNGTNLEECRSVRYKIRVKQKTQRTNEKIERARRKYEKYLIEILNGAITIESW